MMSSNKRQKSVEEKEELVIVYKEGVEVPKNVTKVIFDASVTEIGYGVFSKCEQLREIVLNEGLQKIGNYAFYKCTSLTRIKFPSTVTVVGDEAFSICTNLREVVLNEGLQEIGVCAFYECVSLNVIKLPSTVTEVGSYAFRSCTSLRDVSLNGRLRKSYHRNAFDRSLEYVKFPTISKRVQTLIQAGQTMDIEGKLSGYRHFGWRGGEFLVSPGAFRNNNWVATNTNLDQLLLWISCYELKGATTLFELAMWKAKIEEMGASTAEERSACRGEVPGPAKDAILQYLT